MGDCKQTLCWPFRPRIPTFVDFDISVGDFRTVMMPIESCNANRITTMHDCVDPVALWRSSFVCGLASYVHQIISEYELDLLEDDSRVEALESMARERGIKRETLLRNHVKLSGDFVKGILHQLVPGLSPTSFADTSSDIPWTVVIVLIVFLRAKKSSGKGKATLESKDDIGQLEHQRIIQLARDINLRHPNFVHRDVLGTLVAGFSAHPSAKMPHVRSLQPISNLKGRTLRKNEHSIDGCHPMILRSLVDR